MKHSREYEIAFVGLKPGHHVFNYTINDKFFEHFEKPEFNNTSIEVKLTLDKKQGIFLLHFDINGVITLPCDRCGDDFQMPLWDEFDLVVKQIDDELVAQKNDEDAEVAYIGRSESLLRVDTWIYEFIVLSVPMQHIHPDDEEGNSTCNPLVLKYLNNQNPDQPNGLWDDLKNITN
ncbi:MAG: DUF177 domain-containing protein [Chitinophagaceae bacterium]|nr:DUF177 domain-containing protein [Chitinophagaceae bacterium]